jgi:hypothetical protein
MGSSPASAAALTNIAFRASSGAVGSYAGDPGPSSGASNSTVLPYAIDTSGVQNPAPAAVYQSQRYGNNFSYTVTGLNPGTNYSVRLHFAEDPGVKVGQRKFNVSLNGTVKLANVDVEALAGGSSRAVALIADTTANSAGAIVINFASTIGGDAMVSGIQIVQPVKLRLGGGAIADWQADPGPTSGAPTSTYISSSTIDTSGVVQPAPTGVYQGERFGTSFTYTIPNLTPGAAYTVRLHAAEVSFLTAAGQRQFNVTINGVPSAWNIDYFALTGGANHAYTRSFGTTASSAGQIVIAINGLNNGQAQVGGIEVQPAGFVPASEVDNTTNHYDGLRTSWDPQEQVLTTANVNGSTFGLLQSLPVDASVDAQPLIATNVLIPTLGARHDLLIAATAKDSVYAFDAESGTLIWQRSLLGSGERSLTNNDVGGCEDTVPNVGIMGTPVIDRTSNTLYVVAPSYSSSANAYFYRLHALNLTSGADSVTPVVVTGTVPATGQTFNPQMQRQRAGLTLTHGAVYVGFSSYCDIQVNSPTNPVVGWLMGYNAATLAPLSNGDEFSTTNLNSIWQGGVAPAVDAQGNIYFATGNGPYDGSANLDNSIIKVGPNLARLDSFTTRNQASETQVDADLSGGGVMLVPDQAGAFPHIALQEGKIPVLRALNRDNLGGYSGGPGSAESDLTYSYLTSGCDPTTTYACGPGVWGGIAYYAGPTGQQFVVVADQGSNAHSFALNASSTVTLTPATQSSISLPNEGGATPIVSSNGTLAGSAIVWLINRNDPNFALQAYDASTMNLIYSTTAGQWDSPSADSMLVPTVANGRVYVGGQVLSSGTGQVSIYGLLGSASSLVHAQAVHRRDASTISPIRLAGAVVYGPGSRIIARAFTPRAVPSPMLPNAQHKFAGILRTDIGGLVTLQLRTGRLITVDARTAFARGYYSHGLRIGKACYVTATTVNPRGPLTALSITYLHRPLRSMRPDW